MDINTINEKVQISRFVKNENIIEIIEGDIIVPDIKPDILSLSRVDGNVYITKKEIQDGHLRIDGIIDTYVLYIADNENNQIKGINTILNFSENLDMPELKDGMIVNLTCSLTNIEHKIINGRKISLKCPVEVSVTMIESKLIEVMKGIEDTNDIQKQMQHICFDELVADGNECVSVKENVAVSNGLLPIGEIIKVSTSIEDKDYKISYNKLLAKCELKVCILYIADTEKGELESFETKIPVTGFIDLSGINDQMKFDVNYNIAYLYVKPIYQDLKATAIGVEAEIEFDAIAYNNRTLEVISDLYNPEYEIKYNVETSNIEQKNMITNEKIKVEQMITVPELMNTQLLNVNIKPIITDKHFLDDKLMLNGSIEAEIICYNRNKNNLESRIIEVPYKHSVKLNKKINENNLTLNLSTEYIRYNLDENGQFQLETEININVFELEKITFNTINNVTQTNEMIKPIASVVIYYVKPGDTLWKIAKEYRSTVDSIIKINDLKDESILVGQQLLIPKKIYKISLDILN